MALLTLEETRAGINNVSTQDELTRGIGTLEAQVVQWMNKATALHTAVATADKQTVLDMRADLVARLTAAVAI